MSCRVGKGTEEHSTGRALKLHWLIFLKHSEVDIAMYIKTVLFVYIYRVVAKAMVTQQQEQERILLLDFGFAADIEKHENISIIM